MPSTAALPGRESDPAVLIVGAGLAGLACARTLAEAGIRYELIDASDAPGGRARTDTEAGFLLDRGFQVLLTAYPECQRLLDYTALDLKPFAPGALVRRRGRFHRLVDPWQQPRAAVASLLADVGTVADRFRLWRLRSALMHGELSALLSRPEASTRQRLQAAGFSEDFIDGFFAPFFGGIFLDRSLATSSRMFDFVFRMLATGAVALPARGMGAIASQLAAGLTPTNLRLHCRVTALAATGVTLQGGERRSAAAVVLASDAGEAARLLHSPAVPAWREVGCLYFAAERAPIAEPLLVLDGDADGPVNNLCVPSAVAPGYAPAGAALISATVLGGALAATDAELESAVRAQMSRWFGSQVASWRHLRTLRIAHALPDQRPPALAAWRRPVRHPSGVFVCGDHIDNASINGALESGRRAAEAVIADLSTRGGSPGRRWSPDQLP